MTTPFGRGLLFEDGDLVLEQGRLREVEGLANLSQALTLRVLTPFGSDRFNTGYGLDVGKIFTEAHPVSTVKQLVQANLVRTLGTDPRVRDVREVLFDDDPDVLAANPARAAHHRRIWTVQVLLETVTGDPLTLLVEVGV